MTSALLFDRLQFAFTATFHYLFPQLTMGLALLLLYLRSRALATDDEHYQHVADFWTGIFALNFGFGVVTGIPLEFQFGTNWARFSNFAGGVIGQTLAMEGVFAFFLESSFLGILLVQHTIQPPGAMAGHVSCFSWDHGSPVTLSRPPMHGCNIPSRISFERTDESLSTV
ncbi:MAG: cytochrome ubiquinol oxidase subunit I [Nitrospira sp.]